MVNKHGIVIDENLVGKTIIVGGEYAEELCYNLVVVGEERVVWAVDLEDDPQLPIEIAECYIHVDDVVAVIG